MFRKRLIIAVMFALIFVSSFIAAYFILYNKTAKSIKDDNSSSTTSANAQTVNTSIVPQNLNLVTEKTKVKIIYNYLPVGNEDVIEKSIVESPKKDIIGMNEAQIKDYYNKINYQLSSFSSYEIIVESDVIHSWPPNSYVVKADSDEIVIYSTDDRGQLISPDKTGIKLNMIPNQDQVDVKKGKVYDKYDDVEKLLGDYES